tara:strand:+ start:318 stop:581 length:264 start_codon:yes stop_codon:yes gene_type:complete
MVISSSATRFYELISIKTKINPDKKSICNSKLRLFVNFIYKKITAFLLGVDLNFTPSMHQNSLQEVVALENALADRERLAGCVAGMT